MQAVRAEPYVPPAFAWSCGEDGELCMELNGTAVRMRPSGALYVEAANAIVAGDLHLEKGSSYGVRGQLLPPYDTRATLDRLLIEADLVEAEMVVLLGDTFHDRGAETRLDDEDAARLISLSIGRRLVWITGNHDPEPPKGLPGEAAESAVLFGLTLVHEPEPGAPAGEVAGHLHPCARVASRSGTVRRRCFLTDGRRMILPAFGAYAGGLNVRDPAYQGLFEAPVLAGAMGRDRVHAVGWNSLVPD
jgi:DNA ligase-associated metallophosphoesterase